MKNIKTLLIAIAAGANMLICSCDKAVTSSDTISEPKSKAALQAATATAPDTTGGSKGADWPQWGGSSHNNMASAEKGIPLEMDPGKKKKGSEEIDLATTKNVKWVAKIGSQSYGTPTVGEGKVLIGTNNESPRDSKHQGDRGILMCFDEKDGSFLWQLVILVVWLLPALFGMVMNLVPFLVTRAIARRREDGARTIATWRLAFGIPIYLAWYGAVDLTILVATGRLPLAGMMNLLLPLTGTIALRYWPFFMRSLVHLGHQFRTLANRGQLHALRQELLALRASLVDYSEEFAQVSARPDLPSIKPMMMFFAKGLGKATFLLLAFLFYLLVYLGYLVLDPTTLFVAS